MTVDGRLRVALSGDSSSPLLTELSQQLPEGGHRVEPVGDELDAFVHVGVSAADCRPQPLIDTDDEAWDARCEAPVRGLITALQSAYDGLRVARGQALLIIPATGLEGCAGLTAATAGWEAQRALAKSAARQWARVGIRVNIVAFRLADLQPLQEVRGTGSVVRMAAIDAVRTGPSLDESHRGVQAVVDTVLMLLGPQAAHLTGATVQVDGGALMMP